MLKCCIIGAGFAGELHAQGYDGAARLCGVADTDAGRAEALSRQYGCEAFSDAREMLESVRPDIVSVCVPTHLHALLTRLAAKHGCAVLCEKPLALTDEDCETIARDCGNVKFMTAQVLRWWPEYRAAYELIRAGRIGEIRHISASRLLSASRGGWFLDAQKSGGALFDLMTHDADYVLWLLGNRIERLYAVGRRGENGAWAQVFALLCYENGACASLEAGNGQPHGFPFTTLLRVSGESGCLEVATGAQGNIGVGVKPTTRLTLLENGRLARLSAAAEDENAQERAFKDEIRAFVRAVEQDTPSPIPLAESRSVIRLLNLIRSSLERKVEIRDVWAKLNS